MSLTVAITVVITLIGRRYYAYCVVCGMKSTYHIELCNDHLLSSTDDGCPQLCPQKALCTICKGTGENTSTVICGDCSGTGKVSCNDCKGTAKISCANCEGHGHLSEWHDCQLHNLRDEHYYCTSSSHHGNNVAQYHK